MTPLRIAITTIVSAPFSENTYIANVYGSSQAVVIDPGMDPEAVIEKLEEGGLTPAAVLITHGHSDHIAGNAALKRRWPACPLVIGRRDAQKLTDPWQNLSAAFGVRLVSPEADLLLDDGERYTAAGLEFETRLIPGHSSGHVVFLCRQPQPWVVFGGDVLFSGSVGRTDFPDGDFQALASGIWRHLFPLPADTRVLPGHGPETTVGTELEANPFVGRTSAFGREMKPAT